MQKMLDHLNSRSFNINTIEGAFNCAHELLEGNRLKHTLTVAEQAKKLAEVANLNNEERNLLVMTAYLHDVGYSDKIKFCDFHPLDGSYYLGANGWYNEIRLLTLHHTYAIGLVETVRTDLLGEYHNPVNALPEHLTKLYQLLLLADMTSDGSGNVVSIEERVKDIGNRYSLDNPIYKHILLVQDYIKKEKLIKYLESLQG